MNLSSYMIARGQQEAWNMQGLTSRDRISTCVPTRLAAYMSWYRMPAAHRFCLATWPLPGQVHKVGSAFMLLTIGRPCWAKSWKMHCTDSRSLC